MPVPLHSPHLPARRETGQHRRQLLFLLRGRPTVGRSFVVRPVPGGGSAGCVRLQWPVLQAFVCLPCHFACHAHCPHQVLAPVHLLKVACPRSVLCCPPVHCHVRQDRRLGPAVCQGQQFASYKTVTLAAATRACSGGPCTGPFCGLPSFSCRVHDPGPWV